MKKILFVELLGGLGDLVIALPAIHALALSHPQARLSVLTFPPGAELLAADPLVHRLYRAARGDAGHPDRPRRAVEAILAAERPDLVVADTMYAGIDALLEASGARVVSNLWRHPPEDQLIERRFLQILQQEGLIEPWTLDLKPRLSLATADRVWAAAQLPQPARRALLHPHAGMPIKRWPAERYVALGQMLRDGYGLEIVLPAGIGDAEQESSRQIAAELGPQTVILPPGTLRQYAAAAAHLDLVIGADTGPVRVAAAAGVPSITLFGPTWHGRYGQRPPHINLQGFPECPLRQPADFTRQTCWYSGVCPLGMWQNCLEDIGVGDVLEAARRLLDAGTSTRWGRPLPAEAPDVAAGRPR